MLSHSVTAAPFPLKCGKSYSSAWYHFMETDDTEPLIQTLSKALLITTLRLVKEHLALPIASIQSTQSLGCCMDYEQFKVYSPYES